MEHLTLKAQTTEVDTELGIFTALVSGWTEDREGDTILPTAFDRTIEAWQRAEKNMPLLFEHSARAVGTIFPDSMRVTAEGLVVSGEIDRATDEGEQVWRMIKAGTCAFSIGFMSDSRKREGGGREIYEIDLLEISATSTPAHAATRVVSWKSTAATEPTLTEEQNEILRGLRQEWKAERAAKAAAKTEEEEAARRRRLVNFPTRRTAIILTTEGWKEMALDAAELASAEEIAARAERLAAEAERARVTAESRAKAAEQEPPTISICGMEVSKVTLDGVPVFGGEEP